MNQITAVIAIGNGGCNIADSIRKQSGRFGDAKFIFCDTDVDRLHRHGEKGDEFIALNLDADCFSDVIPADTNTVFIVATLGGTTGSKFAPLAAIQAKKVGARNVVAITTTPFCFEGEDKCAIAQKTAAELSYICDRIIIQDNEKLISDYPELNILTAFQYADKALSDAIEKLDM